jgi:predicted ATP-dependent protease
VVATAARRCAAPDREALMSSSHLQLSADQLYCRTDPASLGFATTAEVMPLAEPFGQDDGLDALEFGMNMRAAGYNVFVLGESGSGRRTFVLDALRSRARSGATPGDWCYVQDFADPRRPRALMVPPGRGEELRLAVGAAVDEIRRAFPFVLASELAAERRAEATAAMERDVRELLGEFRSRMRDDENVVLLEKDGDFGLLPARGGVPLTQEEWATLADDARAGFEPHLREARARLVAMHRRVQELEQQARAAAAGVDGAIVYETTVVQLEPVRARFPDLPQLHAHLDALAQDVVRHIDDFLAAAGDREPGAGALPDFLRRYAVNVAVARTPGAGAPVIDEHTPTLHALTGHIARRLHYGVTVADFTGIAAGALHRANGGYLVLDAEEVLARPLAWSALKRMLRTREIRPVEPAGEAGLAVADVLEPQPIPLAVKVVLIGEPHTFYTLRAMDEEFRELFKVKADFRPDMERIAETERSYAAFVAASGPREGAPPFDAAAVARIIEEGSRLAADQRRLTTRFGLVADLVREAAHWAAESGHEVVNALDVRRALAERDRRERRPHRSLLELIQRRILAFEPVGTAAGQLYGLAVITVGDEAFGRPMRVMATAFVGSGGLSNLEREVAMSGPIHSKAFLLLSGYVARMFARNRPLMLSATISFEQLYEEIEGDSASAAELYALLSAVAAAPIEQGVAVTGAVNQIGTILPVGGVTEKVEGFFAACECVGLTGRQGVILPRRNVENLVVSEHVRAAVAEGRFHVWAIERFEEGWPILTGMVAGEADEDGEYPEGSLYRAVTDRMDAWEAQLREPVGPAIMVYEETPPEPLPPA